MTNLWLTIVLIVHVLAGAAIIGLVLLQHGKGADVGAAFGSGASGSLFGATGSANFLSRATAIFAATFFVTSLGLAYIASHRTSEGVGVMDAVKDSSADKGTPSSNTPAPVINPPTSEPVSPASKTNEVPK